MLIDTLILSEGSTTTNLVIPAGSQTARLNLTNVDTGHR